MTVFARRRFLTMATSAVALAPVPACARAPERSLRPTPRPQLRTAAGVATAHPAEAIIARARLGGSVAYGVIDLSNGQLVESLDPGAGHPPASVAKALTAAYALDALGSGFRFRTRLVATGPVVEGAVQGDLVLAGGGDPVLDTDALAQMVGELRARGVRSVRGRLLVWGGALPKVPRIADDQVVQAGYNASVSGLNLNFNRVHFGWQRSGGGYATSMDARSGRYQPQVSVVRMQVVSRAQPVYTHGLRDGVESWTVAASALGNGGARWLPVRQPELHAGDVLRALAAAQGVQMPAPVLSAVAPVGGTVLAEHASEPLQELLRDMLQFSTNITAEAIGMRATLARGQRPPDLAASARAMSAWAQTRHAMGSTALVDHSGLGAGSRISMPDLARFFAAHASGPLPGLLRDHPMRDANGNIVRNHPVKVAAKTGTLHFVSALGGLMQAGDGARLAFAVVAADLPRRAAIPEAERDRPGGARAWAQRARQMQNALIERWAVVHQ